MEYLLGFFQSILTAWLKLNQSILTSPVLNTAVIIAGILLFKKDVNRWIKAISKLKFKDVEITWSKPYSRRQPDKEVKDRDKYYTRIHAVVTSENKLAPSKIIHCLESYFETRLQLKLLDYIVTLDSNRQFMRFRHHITLILSGFIEDEKRGDYFAEALAGCQDDHCIIESFQSNIIER
ncbi:hypothetical protein EDC14_1003250 [Hydrogenispora ethanolica]|uniref:Uncharacterized protein n=1 Tax=Hydrogenispora ethanolica TaxID=1082276 RepID=A0A4R1S7G8_HYDET|nr:hypothetical protein [Hydrogenispora ethanolica]TCL75316.1 hypothetical protein EDC14_1003250 [Hydrogenispora ethanolica]